MTPDERLPTTTLKVGTIATVVALSAVVAYVQFTGDVGLPPKPPPPASGGGASEQLDRIADSAGSWQAFLLRDAAAAAIAAPAPADMARKLRHRIDEEVRVIAPGEGTVEVAGLKLTAGVADDEGTRRLFTLSIENATDSDLAYRVLTEPRPGGAACNQRAILPHDAIVVRRGTTVVRSECSYRPGMSLRISRVESMELLPLMGFYVSRLPPAALGADPRLARGHQPDLPTGWTVCTTVASQSVRSAIEQGKIAWRDLVDFYARHRCETYTFPEGYRAFEKNAARPLPVVE